MKSSRFFFLIPLLLTSCFQDASKVDFAPGNDLSKASFLRNGDLFLQNSFNAPLEEYVRLTSAEEMAWYIKNKIPFHLYLTNPNCGHCVSSKDAVCSFLQQTQLEFLCLIGPNINQEIEKLKTLLPGMEIPRFPGTPYLMRFNGSSFDLKSVADHATSPFEFGKHILDDINASNVFVFENPEAFKVKSFTSFYVAGSNDPYASEFLTDELRYSLKEFAFIHQKALQAYAPSTLVLEGEVYDVSRNLHNAKEAFKAHLDH